MNQSRPWYSQHVNVPNFCLLGGSLFILCAMGVLEGFSLKCHPSEGANSRLVNFVVLSMGTILLFTGLALNLHKTMLWSAKFSWFYFASNIVIIGVFGLAIYMSSSAETNSTAEEISSIFKFWNATREKFESDIRTINLQKYREQYEISVACRKYEEGSELEEDTNIEKSLPYDIYNEGTQPVLVKFSQEFSDKLSIGDWIQCTLCRSCTFSVRITRAHLSGGTNGPSTVRPRSRLPRAQSLGESSSYLYGHT